MVSKIKYKNAKLKKKKSLKKSRKQFFSFRIKRMPKSHSKSNRVQHEKNKKNAYNEKLLIDDSSSQMIHLDLTDLDAAIEILAQNSDVLIDQIPKDDPVYLAFEKAKLFVSLFYGRPEYPQILERIAKYGKPKVITPGSAGAFLFGCSQDNYGDIDNKFCSPLCTQSIYPGGPDQLSCCPYQIWTWSPESFTKINESTSDQAYIYISDIEDTKNIKFPPELINVLNMNNVKSVQVFATKDSKHILIVPSTPLSNLAQHNGAPLPCANCGPTGRVQPTKIAATSSSSNSTFTNILIALIVIALIVLGIWLFIKYLLPKLQGG